ncbi:predicted protein [Streptomyces lividans TK24]|uniref:Uncharacterized protein n=1 Tax=Streptomyces lividans TK24 TaxID=457428 RepID=A0ABM5R1G8_STRLI|nr:hypothetical protein SLIV_15630 [Streptomyces lividans TK24]EFD67496.1 predicted protein [Streptomyces lividans TK24]KKD14709.1 hypothetical protein TR66_13985 [Streptomyces sp. WM6391]QSJ09633.1 hypothetical protein SLIVDG2_15630 [Streptomyces lividans]QTD70557.1 hypothetical protein SLIVYQS_15630 [Streptomyces lividans TK24] [Streptomyces lividans]
MGLLPVNGATLRADARVREAARDIGARYGVDYTDDAAVTALLTERRKSLETEQRRPAGGRVPELSPQLRALLDGRH